VRNDEVLMRVERAGDALATQRRRRSGAYLRNTGFDGLPQELVQSETVLRAKIGARCLHTSKRPTPGPGRQ
jgi:hypothetical protein